MAEFTSIVLSQQVCVSAPEKKPESWILKHHRIWQEVPCNPLPQSASCQPQSLPGHSMVKGPGKTSIELVKTPSPPYSLEDSEDIFPISFTQVDTSPVPSCALSPSLSLPSMSKGKKTCASLYGPPPLDPIPKVTFYISRVTSSTYPPTSRPGNGQYSSGHLKGFTHGQMMGIQVLTDHSLSQNITV